MQKKIPPGKLPHADTVADVDTDVQFRRQQVLCQGICGLKHQYMRQFETTGLTSRFLSSRYKQHVE